MVVAAVKCSTWTVAPIALAADIDPGRWLGVAVEKNYQYIYKYKGNITKYYTGRGGGPKD